MPPRDSALRTATVRTATLRTATLRTAALRTAALCATALRAAVPGALALGSAALRTGAPAHPAGDLRVINHGALADLAVPLAAGLRRSDLGRPRPRRPTVPPRDPARRTAAPRTAPVRALALRVAPLRGAAAHCAGELPATSHGALADRAVPLAAGPRRPDLDGLYGALALTTTEEADRAAA